MENTLEAESAAPPSTTTLAAGSEAPSTGTGEAAATSSSSAAAALITENKDEKDNEVEAPISARRAKAMSIGNAASLFGTPGDDGSGAALFGSISDPSGSKPSSMAQSPFDAIGEESEEPIPQEEKNTTSLGPQTHAKSPVAESPSDTAAALFGDGGQSPLEWLGGTSNPAATNASNDDASNLFSNVTSQQQQAQDPSLYASGQFGDAQYAYDYSGAAVAAGGIQAYDQAQPEYANQAQAYGQYEEAAVDNFNQNIYYDPAQQLQYQQSLQAQAHVQQQQPASAIPNGQPSTGYAQSQYAQYESQYSADPSQTQYAAYYAQQGQAQADPQSQYAAQQPAYGQSQYQNEVQQQSAANYQSSGYLQAQQTYQTPYSAPAASSQTTQFAQSQSQGSKTLYAPAYSPAYDPYAPSSDPYATQNVYNQPSTSSGHVKQPSLTASSTTPNFAASLQAATTQQPGKKDPKLNRSASSFFAELPPMPAKSRPTSAMGARAAAGTSAAPPVPALPQGHVQQQPMRPPPPKTKSPAPSSIQQRPPSRVKSTQPPAADYGGWSPSMGNTSLSRPGSRTAQRQGSLASNSSYANQPGTSRSSIDQAAQYAHDPYSQEVQQYPSASQQYDPYNTQAMASPPMASRQSVESNRSQYASQYNQSSPYGQPSQLNGQSQSRPQSRTGSTGFASPPPSQSAGLPPAKRVGSRPMAARTASSSSSARAMSPAQRVNASVVSPPVGRALNQLGLAEDDTMEELMDNFSRQRIDDRDPRSSKIPSEDSFNRAATTPLPPSEPDTEARILSPPQGTFKELHASHEIQQTSLSPPPAAVPLLSVSMPSPEMDRKPVLTPSEDDSTELSMPIEMQEADEELSRAEREIKMEEDDIDQKPSHRDLRRSEPWQESQRDNSSYTYGSSPYEAEPEEEKPSESDLTQAWQTGGPEAVYGQPQRTDNAETAQYGGWQQDAYSQAAPYSSGYSEQPRGQETSDAQYAPYESYGAYDQPPQGASSAHGDLYGHYGASAPTADGAYDYDARESVPAQSSYTEPPSTYEPYHPTTTVGTSTHPGISGAASTPSDRLLNRPAIPIASFGFNGKLVTFFPSSNVSDAASYGMMYGQSSSSATVKIQKLSDVLPSDDPGLETFPGPLFMDTGASGASAKAKKKKELLAWLGTRIEDSQKERSYLGAASSDELKAQADQKIVVLQLLKILLEHDGKLTGTPQLDQLVRQALVPHLLSSEHNTFAVAADLGKQVAEKPTSSVTSATDSDLDTIQTHLLKGEKKEAVQYALNNRLYTHALVIASGTDKALLAEVVQDFLAFELGSANNSGREALKVAYSLLAGSGPACINEFVPVKKPEANGHSTGQNATGLLTDAYAPAPSRAPSPLGRAEYPKDVSPRTLSKWQETAAMIVANRTAGDSQALTSLGDVLLANSWYKAAHACFLLSPMTSTLGGPSLPGVRWSLLGAQDPLQYTLAANDLEAIILTEIIEFAFSLVPVPKGQEAYIGLPHLQAYRVLHACHLADAGQHSKAQKYCDAIGATLKLATKRSPFYHPTLLGQVKDLSDRLSMVSFQDKGGSWISRKVQRPTIDNVWSTLESRFAKFVTGDGEEDPAEEERKRKARDAAKGVVGPFAHYSSITPQGPEGLSRNGSYADLTTRVTPPPQATSVPNTVSHAPTTKATHHRRSSSYAYGPYGADPYGNYVPQMPQTTEEPEQSAQEQGQSQDGQAGQPQGTGYGEPQYGYVTPQNDSGWWSNGNGGQETSPYGSSSSYGQAPTFSPVTDGFGSSDAQGLMSPMGPNQSPNMTSQNFQPQPSKLQQEVSARDEMEDDDDLGLGNNSSRRRKGEEGTNPDGSAGEGQKDTDKKTDATKKEEPVRPAAATSGSWLGRIFRREGSASPVAGPIRAKLGEETSFVYDPVEKRWVNKKTGSDTPPPAGTPPPPRAQTASPAGYSQSPAPAKSGTPPPPSARSVSGTPFNAPPPARSTPPPPSGASTSLPGPPPPGSASSTFSSRPPSRAASVPTGELPPPPVRKPGGSGAAAKKARSRYVDVLAQEQK